MVVRLARVWQMTASAGVEQMFRLLVEVAHMHRFHASGRHLPASLVLVSLVRSIAHCRARLGLALVVLFRHQKARGYTHKKRGDTSFAQPCGPLLFVLAMRRTVVLKSTCAAGSGFNPAPVVINEQRIVGSRCGPFEAALSLLADADGGIDVERYVSGGHRLPP